MSRIGFAVGPAPLGNAKSRFPAQGHASIVMTSDVYGHLFPRGDDGSEMAEAEKLLMA